MRDTNRNGRYDARSNASVCETQSLRQSIESVAKSRQGSGREEDPAKALGCDKLVRGRASSVGASDRQSCAPLQPEK